MDQARNKRKSLQGVVVSDRMEKTISVNVERVYRHPKYGKYVRRHKKYHAHDEKRDARSGDVVEIVECRPLSKLKRWRLVRVIERATYPAGGVA
jgi:small subunit ribosomal protein S17